jgi:hypothetical protein
MKREDLSVLAAQISASETNRQTMQGKSTALWRALWSDASESG